MQRVSFVCACLVLGVACGSLATVAAIIFNITAADIVAFVQADDAEEAGNGADD